MQPEKLQCSYSICLINDLATKSMETVDHINNKSFFYEKDFPIFRINTIA